MIQFSLKCSNDHRFDSWFQSSDAYDKLERAGLVTCAICGVASVSKAIMAPRVRPARNAAPAPAHAAPIPTAPAATAPAATDPAQTHPAEPALAALKKHIEANSDYVGKDFAREARAIHDGTAPERAIYGEARPEDARRLIEDGVPIAPLPFVPRRKTN
jgi:hypothetical protein